MRKTIQIRSYKPEDYTKIRKLYKRSGWFDNAVDSKEMLDKQIRKDPDSILVAILECRIVGTLTLLSTGRLALFFRLVTEENKSDIRSQLLRRGEKVFAEKGYRAVSPNMLHIYKAANNANFILAA